MKEFIDKIFKPKKLKKEKEKEVEVIIEEVKEVIKKEKVKKEEVVTYPKPKHFPDCNCFKCDRWKQQNA
jgi:1-acyl-sn-glycerol-3-phosphate acyltransferase